MLSLRVDPRVRTPGFWARLLLHAPAHPRGQFWRAITPKRNSVSCFPHVPWFSFLLLALVASFLPGTAFGDDLSGTVVDPAGQPVQLASVLLSRAGTIRTTTTTDTAGHFSFTGLTNGQYKLHVSIPGFRSEVMPVYLETDVVQYVTVSLRISAIAESVVVSAAQVNRPLSYTPDSVTVIDAEDLRARQVETVSEALRLVPGLTVTQGGGRGGVTSLFPRGGESNFTLVMIDGVRVNTFGGDFDFAHLPTVDIERIEVVRGPQSALYGSDAIGAVVQVITKRGGPNRTSGLVEGGSFGTSRAAGAVSGSHGAWHWGASGERLATDGFTGVALATGEPVTNDDYQRKNGSFRFGWDGTRDIRISGFGHLSSYERGFPGPFGSDPRGNVKAIDTVSRGKNDVRLFSMAAAVPLSDRITEHLHVSWSGLDGTFTSPFGVSESESRRVTVRGQTDVIIAPNLGLSAGGELHREKAESNFITGPDANRVPVKRRMVGAFGELRYEVGERFYVTAGARAEQIHRDFLSPDPNAFSPRPVFDAVSTVSVNPKLSVAYFLQPERQQKHYWTRLYGSAGTGIRPPDAFEIAFTDNPALKPERNRSLELGIEQAIAGGAIIIDGTGFLNRYDDLIVAVGRSLQDASQFRTDNISNARAQGLELAVFARTPWGLEATLTYTWLNTKILAVDQFSDQAPPPFQVGDTLLRRPHHQSTVDLVYRKGPITAFGQLLARGRSLDVEPSLGAFDGLFINPGHSVVNLGGTLTMLNGLDLFARITNLLDRGYEEVFGFSAPGRSAIIGVQVATGR